MDTDGTVVKPGQSLRYRIFEILEIGSADDIISVYCDRFMIALILANVVAVVLATVVTINMRFHTFFLVFELVSVALFTIEYFARLWVCIERLQVLDRSPLKTRLRYIFTPMALVDLAAILPTFLYFLLPDLRFLRIVRLFRLFKLIRYSPALVTLGRVLRGERRALAAAAVVMVSLIIFSASVGHYLERDAQPEAFGDIPTSMWWAITTLTTVGYGDVVPVTAVGRLFGGLVMVFGLAMYALPIGIIASGFANEIGQRDFVITWHSLIKVPLFSQLDAVAITRIADLLKARIVEPGEPVARVGDHAEEMVFVLAGEVEVTIKHHRQVLREGDYFGEVPLLTDSM